MFEALSATLRTQSESNGNLIKLIDLLNKRIDKDISDGDISSELDEFLEK